METVCQDVSLYIFPISPDDYDASGKSSFDLFFNSLSIYWDAYL